MTAPPEDVDVTAATAAEVAEALGVGLRRVRQLAEEGNLRRRGRGRFDLSHALLSRIGAAAVGQDRARRVGADVLAAAGWLVGFDRAPITGDDLAAWRAGVARWGVPADEAAVLLVTAAAALGDRAPRIAAKH